MVFGGIWSISLLSLSNIEAIVSGCFLENFKFVLIMFTSISGNKPSTESTTLAKAELHTAKGIKVDVIMLYTLPCFQKIHNENSHVQYLCTKNKQVQVYTKLSLNSKQRFSFQNFYAGYSLTETKVEI